MTEYTIFGSDISAFTRKLEVAFECYGVDFAIRRKTAEIKEALEAGIEEIFIVVQEQDPRRYLPDNDVDGRAIPAATSLSRRHEWCTGAHP